MEQPSAPETARRSRTAPILAAIAALLFVVLLIVPGYIAGVYCINAHDSISAAAFGGWCADENGDQWPMPIEFRIFFAPSRLAMKIAPPLRNIYWSQFLAGNHTKFF